MQIPMTAVEACGSWQFSQRQPLRLAGADNLSNGSRWDLREPTTPPTAGCPVKCSCFLCPTP